jgi:hypothetical protein
MNDIPLPHHWRKMFDSKYLGEWNLYDDVKKKHIIVELTIESVAIQEVIGEGGKKTMCPILRFVGKRTPMILSVPNGRILRAQIGDDPHSWKGKKFKLGTEQKKVKGIMCHVLRVVAPSARGEDLKEMMAPAPEPENFDGVPEDPDEGP